MSKNLADLTPEQRLAELDDREVCYDIAYRAAQEADFPNGTFDDFRLGYLSALRDADRRAGALEATRVILSAWGATPAAVRYWQKAVIAELERGENETD